MSLTSIGQQKTPGRPIEITFAAETGLPSDSQEVLLIGHVAVTYPASGLNKVITINNSADRLAASGECVAKGFGAGSELTKMVLAAIKANEGGSQSPQLKVVPLGSAVTDFGTLDAALEAVKDVKAEFVVSPYPSTNTVLGDKLKAAMAFMSGAQRVHNNQFGSVGLMAAIAVDDPSTLHKYDSQFILAPYLRDMSGSYTYLVGELAAACAARIAASVIPFNPQDDITIVGVPAPVNMEDNLTIGAGLESESALNQGHCPLKVKPNGEVAFVRTVTARLSADGSGTPVVGAYYDMQDFMVLYFWRKTLFTRFSAPDMKQRKASQKTADDILGEMLRLATAFQDQEMFQAVDKLAKQFVVERNASDRHRFDYITPVNVIPGLHVIAGNIQATTEFDVLTI